MRRRSDRQGKPADDNPRAMQEQQEAHETSHDEHAPQRLSRTISNANWQQYPHSWNICGPLIQCVPFDNSLHKWNCFPCHYRSCVKILSLLAVVLGIVYLCVPFVVRFFPRIMYHAVFSHVGKPMRHCGYMPLFMAYIFSVDPWSGMDMSNKPNGYLCFFSIVRVPFLADLSRPEELGLNHTVNLYLSSEEGVTLGIW